MDIPAYIDSGILENYALGLATATEAHELEQLAKEFPAIRIELNKVEESLSRFVFLLQKNPPPHLRSLIIKNATSVEPAARTESKIVALHQPEAKKGGWAPWLVAALVILIGGGGAFFYFQQQKLLTANNLLVQTKNENELLNVKMLKQTEDINSMQHSVELMMKPGNKIIELKGMDKAPDAMAIVCWNKQSKEVMLNVITMPGVPQGKQYQLWAMVAGQPVNLGVFDVASDQSSIKTMKTIDNPEMFEVTLETLGGSATPTESEMYVMGKNL